MSAKKPQPFEKSSKNRETLRLKEGAKKDEAMDKKQAGKFMPFKKGDNR